MCDRPERGLLSVPQLPPKALRPHLPKQLRCAGRSAPGRNPDSSRSLLCVFASSNLARSLREGCPAVMSTGPEVVGKKFTANSGICPMTRERFASRML